VATDVLASKREEIAARLRELEPLAEEHRQLEQGAKALAAIDGTTAVRSTRPSTSLTTAPGTTTRARTRATSGARRGPPRGTGTRALQTLELVRSQPEITIPEIATKMGIKQNYLYRVLPGLAKDGQIDKRDRGWHASSQPTGEARS
jgi:hypothetical protein